MLRASKSPEGAGFDLVARLQALETLVAALEQQHAPETETTPGEEPANEAPPAAEP